MSQVLGHACCDRLVRGVVTRPYPSDHQPGRWLHQRGQGVLVTPPCWSLPEQMKRSLPEQTYKASLAW